MPSLARSAALLAMTAGAPAFAVLARPADAHRPPTPIPATRAAILTGELRDGAGAPVAGATIVVAATPLGAVSDARGRFALRGAALTPGGAADLVVRRIGYAALRRRVALAGDSTHVVLTMRHDALALEQVVADRRADRSAVRQMGGTSAALAVAPALPVPFAADASGRLARVGAGSLRAPRDAGAVRAHARDTVPYSREGYDRIEDNPFLAVAGNPRSTFSIDVDRASYGNVRRFLTRGSRPPADAVRIEELVNYFPYALPAPRGEHPLAVTTEVMPAPWQPRHRLVRVALQARRIETAALPPSHLVFLLDVSGSMASPDKLPLVKEAFRLLVAQLRPQDRIAIAVYAGAAGLVLPPTSGRDQARILEAIDRLEAGGSTAGGEGLLLAYKVAQEMRGEGGRANTRVVLATDGDFNVGVSSDAELERLVERQRAAGTYLTVLGFGTGNYQDAKMEKLAARGNGNYAYVDDLAEARKVLVQELGATLHVVAQDVKLQVEFNPAAVRAYRLIGYENRLLRDEDFADDRKDAGDVGAGHTVTALYEVVPAGVTGTVAVRGTAPLRYGDGGRAAPRANGELLFVQLRYKRPGASASTLVTQPVRAADAAPSVAAASPDSRFAAAVAAFGMLLRGSEHRGAATGADVLALARGAVGDDPGGHRAEFVQLVERWRRVAADVAANRNGVRR